MKKAPTRPGFRAQGLAASQNDAIVACSEKPAPLGSSTGFVGWHARHKIYRSIASIAAVLPPDPVMMHPHVAPIAARRFVIGVGAG